MINDFFLLLIPLGLIIFVLAVINSLKHLYIPLILTAIGSYAGYIGALVVSKAVAISLFQIFLFIFILFFVIQRIYRDDFNFRLMNLELEWFLFFLLIFLSIIYTPARLGALIYVLRILVLIIMVYFIINSVENYKGVFYLLVAITLFSSVLAYLSAKEGFQTENMIINLVSQGHNLKGRSSVNIDDPNIFASHFMIPILFTISLILHTNISRKIRIFALFFLPVLMIGIAATFSRSAWLSVVFGIFILTMIRKQFKLYLWGALALVFVVILVPEIRLIFENIFQRVLQIFEGASDDSSRVRVILLIAAINMIVDSHMLGVGFLGYESYFTHYFTVQETIGVALPHNLFYTLFAELGLMGFLLYLWILWRMGKVAYYNYKNQPDGLEGALNLTLLVSYIAYIFFYQFYDGGLVDNNFWIIVGAIYSIKFIQQDAADKLSSVKTA